MFSFSMVTCSMSSSPLVNSLVKNWLFKTAPDIDEPPFHFIHTIMDLSVVDTMLYYSPDLVIHRTEIWAVWRPQARRKKVWRFLTQQFTCCTCVAQCAGALCSWNKVVTRHSAYHWQQYDVLMTSWWCCQVFTEEWCHSFMEGRESIVIGSYNCRGAQNKKEFQYPFV